MDKKVLFALVVVLALISTTESWWRRRRRASKRRRTRRRWLGRVWNGIKRVGKKIVHHAVGFVKHTIKAVGHAVGLVKILKGDDLQEVDKEKIVGELKDLREKDLNTYRDSFMIAAHELLKDMSEEKVAAKLMEMDEMLSDGKETVLLEDMDQNSESDNENLEELLRSLEEDEKEQGNQADPREEELSSSSEEVNV